MSGSKRNETLENILNKITPCFRLQQITESFIGATILTYLHLFFDKKEVNENEWKDAKYIEIKTLSTLLKEEISVDQLCIRSNNKLIVEIYYPAIYNMEDFSNRKYKNTEQRGIPSTIISYVPGIVGDKREIEYTMRIGLMVPKNTEFDGLTHLWDLLDLIKIKYHKRIVEKVKKSIEYVQKKYSIKILYVKATQMILDKKKTHDIVVELSYRFLNGLFRGYNQRLDRRLFEKIIQKVCDQIENSAIFKKDSEEWTNIRELHDENSQQIYI